MSDNGYCNKEQCAYVDEHSRLKAENAELKAQLAECWKLLINGRNFAGYKIREAIFKTGKPASDAVEWLADYDAAKAKRENATCDTCAIRYQDGCSAECFRVHPHPNYKPKSDLTANRKEGGG